MQFWVKCFLFFILYGNVTIYAQQKIQFTHTRELYPLSQPAFRATSEKAQVGFINRSQWLGYTPSTDIGLDGNPVSQGLFFFSPVSISGEETKNEAVGFSLINDNIGIINQKRLSASLSKQIKVGSEKKLSFGIKPGIVFQKLKQQEFVSIDSNDPIVDEFNNSNTLSSITLDAGLWYYSTNYGIGLSAINLIKSNDLLIDSRGIQLDFYSRIKLTNTVSITPRLNFVSDFYNFSWLLGADTKLTIVGQEVKGGIFFRQSTSSINDISIQLGLPQIRGSKIGFSYAVDFVTSNVNVKSSTSHEIMLMYYLGRKKHVNSRPLYSPRYKIEE